MAAVSKPKAYNVYIKVHRGVALQVCLDRCVRHCILVFSVKGKVRFYQPNGSNKNVRSS